MEPPDAGAGRQAEGRDGAGKGTRARATGGGTRGRRRWQPEAARLGSFPSGGEAASGPRRGQGASEGGGRGNTTAPLPPLAGSGGVGGSSSGQSRAGRQGEREAGSEGGGSGRREEGGTRRASDRVAAGERTRCRRRRSTSASSGSSSRRRRRRRREKFHSRLALGSPRPRADWGARPAAATRGGLGVRSAPNPSRRQRPGLGARRRRRGGWEPRTRAPRRSRSASVGAGQPRWPCAPAARG